MTVSDETRRLVTDLATEAKEASRVLARLDPARKNAVLVRVADALRGEAKIGILVANEQDVEAAIADGMTSAMLDRLRLTPQRLDGVADSVAQIARLDDPVGNVEGLRTLESGLTVGRMTIPLGVIGIIYESRPNVTADAAALCLKSGNATLLRGGKEAFRSNQAIARIFGEALEAEGLPTAAVTLLPTTDRAATTVLIGLDRLVDLIIPRGGESLIRFVVDHARVPVVQHYKGVCHVYVDEDADLDQALAIALNSKVQRPGVCNAMETLLVDRGCAAEFVPRAFAALRGAGVTVRGDAAVQELADECEAANDEDWDAEYLDLILSMAVVDGIDGAISHIARHGSHHTEAIVTTNYDKARRFIREVDASLVLANASTRFND
ncbi:MAG: glutamate-5-semialdehyde dehydrogenase, partial [Deltaproteobacteria bacterium]|nr:glutamate-5-semialdehyde dehydrogenase [Deltaproteobacteria bacterium]